MRIATLKKIVVCLALFASPLPAQQPSFEAAHRAVHALANDRSHIPGIFSDDADTLPKTTVALQHALREMSHSLNQSPSHAITNDLIDTATFYQTVSPESLNRFSQKDAAKAQQKLDSLTANIESYAGKGLNLKTIVAIRTANAHLRALLTPAMYGRSSATRNPDAGGAATAIATGTALIFGLTAAGYMGYKKATGLAQEDILVAASEHALAATDAPVTKELLPEHALTTQRLTFNLEIGVVSVTGHEASAKLAYAGPTDTYDRIALALPGEHDIVIRKDLGKHLSDYQVQADMQLCELMDAALVMFDPLMRNPDLLTSLPDGYEDLKDAIYTPTTGTNLEQRHAQVVLLHTLLKAAHEKMMCPVPFYDFTLPGSMLYNIAAEKELAQRHATFIQTIKTTQEHFVTHLAPVVTDILKDQSYFGYDPLDTADKELLRTVSAYESCLHEFKRKKKYQRKALSSAPLVDAFYTLQEMQDRADDIATMLRSAAGSLPTEEEEEE